MKIAKEIENKLFIKLFILDDNNNSKYIKKAKQIIANLANEKNKEFRKRVLNGEITSEKLMSMKVIDMAPCEKRNERKTLEQKAFNCRRIDSDN